jgi:hypothetical protein
MQQYLAEIIPANQLRNGLGMMHRLIVAAVPASQVLMYG